jgi:hypothetical protein
VLEAKYDCRRTCQGDGGKSPGPAYRERNKDARGQSVSDILIQNNHIHNRNDDYTEDYFPCAEVKLNATSFPESPPPAFQDGEQIWTPGTDGSKAKGILKHFAWNGSNWQWNDGGIIKTMAKQTVRKIMIEASKAGDKEERQDGLLGKPSTPPDQCRQEDDNHKG